MGNFVLIINKKRVLVPRYFSFTIGNNNAICNITSLQNPLINFMCLRYILKSVVTCLNKNTIKTFNNVNNKAKQVVYVI